MIRGVSTEFVFDLPCNFTDLHTAQIVFWQEDYHGLSDSRPLPIIKVLGQCKQGDKPTQLSVELNREETMRFADDRKAYVQLTGVKNDGHDIGHKKETITVYPIYDDSILNEDLLPTPDYNGWVYLDGHEIDEGEW